MVATHDFSDGDEFYLCCYLDFGPDGHVYLPEAAGSEILELDASAALIGRWGSAGSELGQFGFHRDPQDLESAIGGISMASDGSAYVVEAGNKRVQLLRRIEAGATFMGIAGDT